jgi:hypothetical protein
MGPPGTGLNTALLDILHPQYWVSPASLGGPTGSHPVVLARAPTTKAKGSSALLLKNSLAGSAQGVFGPLCTAGLVSSGRARPSPRAGKGIKVFVDPDGPITCPPSRK